jgi:hypothetical protein
MTDYRDPNYRDPNRRDPVMTNDPALRDPSAPSYSRMSMDSGWSNATWGWIAGICVVALILIFAFGSSNNSTETATNPANPPATTGQRQVPAPQPGGAVNEAPTSRPATPAPAAPANPPAR